MTSLARKTVTILLSFMISFFAVSAISGQLMPSEYDQAYAAIKVGGEEIQGYQPSDVLETDQKYAIDPENTADQFEQVVIKLVKIAMPLLMMACVVIIIYNAARNIVRRPEDRVKMGDLIKNMFVNFFFILFAWVIVEGIVFIVTNGELILFSTILS